MGFWTECENCGQGSAIWHEETKSNLCASCRYRYSDHQEIYRLRRENADLKWLIQELKKENGI